MASTFSFGQLPEEEIHFLEYLTSRNEVWARAEGDAPINPTYQPLPVADFLNTYSQELIQYHKVGIYIGSQTSVLSPRIYAGRRIIGGTLESVNEDGTMINGVSRIIGGTEIEWLSVDDRRSELIFYRRGIFSTPTELHSSLLCFYSTYYDDEVRFSKSEEFLKWAKNVLAWVRKRTQNRVRAFRCNYDIPATDLVFEASKTGLKLWP